MVRDYCRFTVVLMIKVEEDTNESYSRVIFKYYIAEGVMCGHSLLLSSASEKPTDLLNVRPLRIINA